MQEGKTHVWWSRRNSKTADQTKGAAIAIGGISPENLQARESSIEADFPLRNLQKLLLEPSRCQMSKILHQGMNKNLQG